MHAPLARGGSQQLGSLLRAAAGRGGRGAGAPHARGAAPPAGQPRRVRTTAAGAPSAAAAAAAAGPLREPFLLTLERAVGERAGADAALAGSGLFGAEVFPDLPLAMSWDGLGRAMLK